MSRSTTGSIILRFLSVVVWFPILLPRLLLVCCCCCCCCGCLCCWGWSTLTTVSPVVVGSTTHRWGTSPTVNNHHYHRPKDGRSIQPCLASLRDNKLTNGLTDWVIENLESSLSEERDKTANSWAINNNNMMNQSFITSISKVQAGENDTLPKDGLEIGSFVVLPAGAPPCSNEFLQDILMNNDTTTTTTKKKIPIRLLLGRNGWGTGVHPTTRLCLEWLDGADIIQPGDVVLDYGTGSGILSIVALHKGADRVVGVDIEAEALVTAVRNVAYNFLETSLRFEGYHTREIVPMDPVLHRSGGGNGGGGGGVDVCVANILIGQLVRPSMVAALVTNIRPGGWLCLSGIRPDEVDSLKAAYDNYIEWIPEYYQELSAQQTPGSLESYGFDCGTWSRLVGRRKQQASDDAGNDILNMSDLAVS